MKTKQYLLISFVAAWALLLMAFSGSEGRAVPRPDDDSLPLLIFKAREHKGKSAVSTSGLVSLTTGFDNDHYYLDSSGRTGYLYIETKLAAFRSQQLKRVPLNISIVIDRSGSMTGTKMGYAKKAARNIIDLLGEEDYVSIVMYDNVVDSVQGPVRVKDKASIQSKIDAIRPRGGTNLWGGTEKGYEFVRQQYRPGYVNRVLLISDGLANIGITDSSLIRLKVEQFKNDVGITLSTFGVGLDYNEKLMTDMAETGAGNYYFIDAPEKTGEIFNRELNGLSNIAAQEATLRIKLPKGISIIQGYPLRFQQQGDEAIITLRDLFADDTKATLFRFRIADRHQTPLKIVTTLRYTDVTDGQTRTLVNENHLTPVRNVDAYLTHFNKPVVVQAILYTANENLEKAMLEVDRGEYAEAQRFLNANTATFRINSSYILESPELRHMDSVNTGYILQAGRGRSMSADSMKMMQKSNRAINYRIRSKKQ
ncbi:MAG TPA: VWA domain-containing protein [Flavisolibacter sp.]|nr:VWA domain-containing protein [Flavisolibacter sp.]